MINGLAGSGRDPVGDGKMASYNALKQKVLADERQKKLDERARIDQNPASASGQKERKGISKPITAVTCQG